MKTYYLRTVAALACAFGLVACGGGNDDLALAVHVSGVTQNGLTLTNNGGEPEAVLTPWTSYIFKNPVGSDSNFEILVKTSPPGTTCEVINGKGKTSSYAPTNIFVVCSPIPHNVTATITGLGSNAGMVVVNGPVQYTIPADATTFNFTLKDSTGKVTGGQVGEGIGYGFAVLTQPANKTCTIPNGAGIMGSTDVVININCV
jgi:hypothetical protein